MVQLHFTRDGRLILPDPDLLYCPGDKKGTRKVREHLQRVRDEMIAEHERLKAQVLERIRNQPSARAAAEAAAGAAAAEAAAVRSAAADAAAGATAVRSAEAAAAPVAAEAGARGSTERGPEP